MKNYKTRVTITKFNQENKIGEAKSDKNQVIHLSAGSFDKDVDVGSVKVGVELLCDVYNIRQEGLIAYHASVAK